MVPSDINGWQPADRPSGRRALSRRPAAEKAGHPIVVHSESKRLVPLYISKNPSTSQEAETWANEPIP